ncbi:MAG: hypothetical protein NC191_07235 [Muribaculaceae bacterium]|nr:hypothetical protein [Muribaculaceae bacterium]
MFNIGQLPQISRFSNNKLNDSSNKVISPFVNQKNALERSPQCDSVKFTGNFDKPNLDDEEIYEVEPEDFSLVPDDDCEVVEAEPVDEVDPIAMYHMDELDRQIREVQEDEDRRRKEEDEIQMNNDILLYGVVTPLIVADTLDDDITSLDNYNPLDQNDLYPDSGLDDLSLMDDGFDDFGF